MVAEMLARADAVVVRGIDWSAEHWLDAWNAFMGIWVGLAVLGPALLYLGFNRVADLIYRFYSYSCLQLATHSWFLLGNKLCLCERCMAIYGSMLLGGIVYARGRRGAGISFLVYFVLALPLLIDGGTATLGLRDSTPLLRTITGTLFGLASVWFIYPHVDRLVSQTGTVQPPL